MEQLSRSEKWAQDPKFHFRRPWSMSCVCFSKVVQSSSICLMFTSWWRLNYTLLVPSEFISPCCLFPMPPCLDFCYSLPSTFLSVSGDILSISSLSPWGCLICLCIFWTQPSTWHGINAWSIFTNWVNKSVMKWMTALWREEGMGPQAVIRLKENPGLCCNKLLAVLM